MALFQAIYFLVFITYIVKSTMHFKLPTIAEQSSYQQAG